MTNQFDAHPMLELEPVSDELYAVSNLRIDRLSERRLWVFDLEATGLDTRKERVTQIAGVPVEGGQVLVDESFSIYVQPGIDIPTEIQELTGITNDTVSGAPGFADAWMEGVAAAEGCDFWIGQSVFEFDVPLLEVELPRHDLSPLLPPILDSVVVATKLLGPPDGRWSTSALVYEFQVDTSGLRRHNALDDVIILGRTLVPMLERIRLEHDDCFELARHERLPIKRHPPITTDEEATESAGG